MGLSPKQLVLIHKCAQWLLRASVAMVNWVRPSPRTIEYQVALSYADALGSKVQQPTNAKSKITAMKCPSYPMGLSESVFAKKPKSKRKFTFLNALTDIPEVDSDDRSRSHDSLYRLAGMCVTGGCFHWTGESCQLGAAVASVKIRKKNKAHCAIRSTCRWYAERSSEACSTCVFVHYSTLFDNRRVQQVKP